MIKQYLLLLLFTYVEYFTFWSFLEKKKYIIWDNIKFWLKYPPFISLFFFFIDKLMVGQMIYITFFFPYLLLLYCVKNINRDVFKQNKILINTSSCISPETIR